MGTFLNIYNFMPFILVKSRVLRGWDKGFKCIEKTVLLGNKLKRFQKVNY